MTTPYRDGKPLADVIPPDRRRQRAILMIAGGMVGGVVLLEAGRFFFRSPEPPKAEVHVGSIASEEIRAVVNEHKATLRDRCFSPHDLVKASVKLDIVVGKQGDVLQTHYEGTDSRVTTCVDREVRQWRFPAHAEDSPPTRIPFDFERNG